MRHFLFHVFGLYFRNAGSHRNVCLSLRKEPYFMSRTACLRALVGLTPIVLGLAVSPARSEQSGSAGAPRQNAPANSSTAPNSAAQPQSGIPPKPQVGTQPLS